jgi:hypothetical protein
MPEPLDQSLFFKTTASAGDVAKCDPEVIERLRQEVFS